MEIVKSLLSQKSQFDLEKIKNKNRTRASLFQSTEDGKQEIFLCGVMPGALSNTYFVYVELKVSTDYQQDRECHNFQRYLQ